jgi:hypothetical protein
MIALRSAESWITERRTLWERRLDRLGDYLADTAGPAGTRSQENDPPKEAR